MKTKTLVVNGCSYSQAYAGGQGHQDLAKLLGIESYTSLAIGGSANSRILRTTLKHSYRAKEPVLYLLGMTFVSRLELPILTDPDEDASFEGRWINPQNTEFSYKWAHNWTRENTLEFVEIKLASEVYSLLDRTEDLMYRILATIADLQSRGHQALVYQQADDSYQQYVDSPKLALFKNNPNIIGDFFWRAIEYQHLNNVPKAPIPPVTYIGPTTVPDHMRHPLIGKHQVINKFLYEYIKSNGLV